MKATAATVAAMVGSASAFVAPALPDVRSVASTKMMATPAGMSTSLPFLPQPAKLDGTMAGDVGFDPLGLSEVDDLGIDLYWLREAELKHGRIAMLAVTGILWADEVGSLPGMPEGKSQMDVFWQVWAEKPALIGSILFFITIVEAICGVAITKGKETGRAPGDYGIDPLALSRNAAKRADLELKEIKHCRLAMWAAAGLILQGCTTHESALSNFNSIGM